MPAFPVQFPMSYEFLVGLRYTRSKRRAQGRNRFISFISLVSMLGIALGVAALIVVLSVMNGFQRELRTRILGVASHVQVSGFDGELANWQRVADDAAKHPRVQAAAPFVQAQGMLSFDQTVRGTLIRGVLPDAEDQVADFARHMRFGRFEDLQPGAFGIVLGADLARALRVGPGEKVTLIAPQGLVTPAAILPRLKQFRVVGIFEVGMYEYDSSLALIHLQDAQTLYRMEDRVTGVRLKLDDLFAAPRVARELMRYLDADTLISDWTKSHANFFRAVQIEKNVMFIILLLIVAVAAFNIVSTLVMAVQDKQADIAILRTLGASPGSIMGIFVIQGGADRLHRAGHRRDRRGESGAQHRRGGAGHRTPVRRAVPRQGRLLHFRPAVGAAVVRRRHDHRRLLRADPGGDALPELAGVAAQPGGGPAL